MCARDSLTPRPRHQRGMSLIEMMVGLVVALLVVLAAVGATQFFMGRQRAALDIGAGGANEATGLAAIKEEVAQAGLGFYADGRLLCPTLNLSQGIAAVASAAPLAPLHVTLQAGGVILDALYGSALEAVSPAPLAAPTASGAASIALASYLPVAPGDAVLLVPAAGGSAPCTVRTATAVVPATDAAPLTLATDAGGEANQVAFPSVAYGSADAASRLGRLQWSRFRLDGGDLVLERPLDGTRAVLVHDVVAFAAEYGVTDASGSVAAWHKATDEWADLQPLALAAVRAVRIGVVVRSAAVERKDAVGHCNASAQPPLLFGDVVGTADPDWACRRYRVGSIVVPLRNVAMGSGL